MRALEGASHGNHLLFGALANRLDLFLELEIVGMIHAQIATHIGQLFLEIGAIVFQQLYVAALEDIGQFGQGLRAALECGDGDCGTRARLCRLTLQGDQTCRQLLQAHVLDIEPFVDRHDLIGALIVAELSLRTVEAFAQFLHALIEPDRLLAGRLDAQFEVGIDIGLGELIGQQGRKLRVLAGIADLQHRRLARGFDLELRDEQIGDPFTQGGRDFAV